MRDLNEILLGLKNASRELNHGKQQREEIFKGDNLVEKLASMKEKPFKVLATEDSMIEIINVNVKYFFQRRNQRRNNMPHVGQERYSREVICVKHYTIV